MNLTCEIIFIVEKLIFDSTSKTGYPFNSLIISIK